MLTSHAKQALYRLMDLLLGCWKSTQSRSAGACPPPLGFMRLAILHRRSGLSGLLAMSLIVRCAHRWQPCGLRGRRRLRARRPHSRRDANLRYRKCEAMRVPRSLPRKLMRHHWGLSPTLNRPRVAGAKMDSGFRRKDVSTLASIGEDGFFPPWTPQPKYTSIRLVAIEAEMISCRGYAGVSKQSLAHSRLRLR